MRITLTANAGLHVKFKEASFLIDGLHKDRAEPFSSVPDSVLNEAIKGRGAFSNIDALIFTHTHKDHYNEECACAFLENHKETEFIFPALDNSPKDFIKYDINGVAVEAWKLPHEGEQFKDVINYGYFIYDNAESIFISGDASIDSNPIISFLNGRRPKAAALCFPFVTLERGRKIIEQIDPKIVVAYHLPFEYEDENRYCISCRRVAESGKLLYPVEILCQPKSEIVI